MEEGAHKGPLFNMSRVLQYQRNPFLKGTIHTSNSDPDQFTLQTTEELSRLLKYCREREQSTRHEKRDGLFHVAEIPAFIYEQAVQEGWDTPEGWKRWLNDPANACFRTWRGRV